jgi:hypothetical protein
MELQTRALQETLMSCRFDADTNGQHRMKPFVTFGASLLPAALMLSTAVRTRACRSRGSLFQCTRTKKGLAAGSTRFAAILSVLLQRSQKLYTFALSWFFGTASSKNPIS